MLTAELPAIELAGFQMVPQAGFRRRHIGSKFLSECFEFLSIMVGAIFLHGFDFESLLGLLR